jgi:hypothetical protein
MRRLLVVGLVGLATLTALAPVANASLEGYAYPRDVRNAFIRGCVEGGGARASCRCVIRKIERRYTLRQFLKIAKRAERTGRFPTPINRMIESCA